jgi:Ca-activated chloride channel family protein
MDKLKGDRAGLVAFAGDAFVQCPVTTDYGALKMFLDVLDPAAVANQGTAIGAALRKTRQCFDPKENKYKVAVLITDGEDNAEDPVAEAKKGAAEGVIIYCLGIGTKGGVPIPLKKRAGGVVYKKDKSGNTVLTTLNEEVLAEIALATGGKYFHSTGAGLELDRIYQEINKLEKKELKSLEFNRYKEQFMWPLAFALALLIFEYFLSARRKKKKTWDGRFA